MFALSQAGMGVLNLELELVLLSEHTCLGTPSVLMLGGNEGLTGVSVTLYHFIPPSHLSPS